MLALTELLGHKVLGCVDPERNKPRNGIEVFRSDEQAIAAGGFEGVILAIDNPKLRERVCTVYLKAGLNIIALEGGKRSSEIELGIGLVAQQGSVIGHDCSLGNGVRLNIGAFVMDGSVVGDFVTCAPRSTALEGTKIGARSYIGANATLLPGTVIGADCIVGAAAVVSGYVPDCTIIRGNPAA